MRLTMMRLLNNKMKIFQKIILIQMQTQMKLNNKRKVHNKVNLIHKLKPYNNKIVNNKNNNKIVYNKSYNKIVYNTNFKLIMSLMRSYMILNKINQKDD